MWKKLDIVTLKWRTYVGIIMTHIYSNGNVTHALPTICALLLRMGHLPPGSECAYVEHCIRYTCLLYLLLRVDLYISVYVKNVMCIYAIYMYTEETEIKKEPLIPTLPAVLVYSQIYLWKSVHGSSLTLPCMVSATQFCRCFRSSGSCIHRLKVKYIYM